MTRPHHLWLVTCAEGHYSDARFWVVAGYFDHAQALEHARQANEWARAFIQRLEESDYQLLYEEFPCPVDSCRNEYELPRDNTEYAVRALLLPSSPEKYAVEGAVLLDELKSIGAIPP